MHSRSRLGALLIGAGVACLLATVLGSVGVVAAHARVGSDQALAVLLSRHSVHRSPRVRSPVIADVSANRPITG
jgi:hypothetical protein